MKNIFSFLKNLPASAKLDFSLINTHTKGLHSVVFEVGPPMVRMYFAAEDHDLWKNEIRTNRTNLSFPYDLSIAIHSHRQDITLIPIFGTIINFTLSHENNSYGLGQIELSAYQYISPILEQEGKFIYCGAQKLFLSQSIILQDPLFLSAKELHTIFIPQNTSAAWFVIEGEKDLNYNSTCYSNSKLENIVFDQMYQKMDLNFLEKVKSEIFNNFNLKNLLRCDKNKPSSPHDQNSYRTN